MPTSKWTYMSASALALMLAGTSFAQQDIPTSQELSEAAQISLVDEAMQNVRAMLDAAGAEGTDERASMQAAIGNDETDPFSASESADLVASGVIERQEQLSESLLLLSRQRALASAIDELALQLGPDAKIEIAPGRFANIENTPAGIRARIEMEKLQQELNEILAENEPEPEVDPAEMVTPDDLIALQQQIESTLTEMLDDRISALNTQPAPLGRPRADGGSFMQLPGSSGRGIPAEQYAQQRTVQAEMEPRQQLNLEPEPEPEPEIIRPSLREVLGSGGRFVAFVNLQGEKIRVIEGDVLPGGFRVMEIGEGSITYDVNGDVITDEIPG